MAEWVKALAAKPKDGSLILRTYMGASSDLYVHYSTAQNKSGIVCSEPASVIV